MTLGIENKYKKISWYSFLFLGLFTSLLPGSLYYILYVMSQDLRSIILSFMIIFFYYDDILFMGLVTLPIAIIYLLIVQKSIIIFKISKQSIFLSAATLFLLIAIERSVWPISEGSQFQRLDNIIYCQISSLLISTIILHSLMKTSDKINMDDATDTPSEQTLEQ
jgi:hypothetical protein